jgi:hypothetical protein
MRKVFKLVKKIVLSGFTLFAFNLMVRPLNFVIPINVITIIFVTIFGIMALPFFSVLLIFFF